MRYTIQNNGSDTVLIRVYAPALQVASFLAFIDQKSREHVPKIKTASSSIDDSYLINLTASALSYFDSFLLSGSSIPLAISATNNSLKASGYANMSYDMTKQLLQKNGKLRQKR